MFEEFCMRLAFFINEAFIGMKFYSWLVGTDIISS